MLNKVGKLTFIVCVCSLFLWQNLSFGYSNQWRTEDNELENKYNALGRAEKKLDRYKDALSSLIGKWAGNERKISSNAEVTLSGAFATSATVLATALSKSTPITSVAGGLLTLRKAVDWGMAISASDSYVSAMSTADSAVESAVADIATAYSEYKSQYDRYLGVCAGHQLCRYNGNVASAVYSKSQLDTAVNKSNPGQTRGWYHPTQSPSAETEHSIDPFYDEDEWDMSDLPHDYKCKGSCSDKFRSPYGAFSEHRTSCGTAEKSYIDEYMDIPLLERLTGTISAQDILDGRSVEQGCGRPYYTCDGGKVAEHKERTCAKSAYKNNEDSGLYELVEYTCGRSYRRCMERTFDHHPALPGKTEHSDTPDSSSSGDDDDDDTEQDTQGLQTEQTQTSTPSYHPCGVHETSVSGTHSAAGCGVSGHYVCDGSDHSLQASCTTTNASGQYCTVSSFYACQSHTHVYPAPEPIQVLCRRGGCNDLVDNTDAHWVTCDAGHGYWSCKGSHHGRHRTRTCRFSECRQTWTNCNGGAPICNKPWRKANGKKCWE
ncbi:MAG: hypothetical protein OXI67_01540 [Candidatus Poribacteria bacterium]|nr:hypothetical protein [Candidatus Poribacteria bacterium]